MLGIVLLLQRFGCLGGNLPVGCSNEDVYLILQDAFQLVCDQQTAILQSITGGPEMPHDVLAQYFFLPPVEIIDRLTLAIEVRLTFCDGKNNCNQCQAAALQVDPPDHWQSMDAGYTFPLPANHIVIGGFPIPLGTYFLDPKRLRRCDQFEKTKNKETKRKRKKKNKTRHLLSKLVRYSTWLSDRPYCHLPFHGFSWHMHTVRIDPK